MSEIERLRQRLEAAANDPKFYLADIKVFWAPESTATPEERAKALNDVLDAIESGRYGELPPIGDSVRQDVAKGGPTGRRVAP